MHWLFAAHTLALRDLIFMVWKLQVDAAGMDIELFSKVLLGHGGALDVPAGEAYAPGTGPVHLALFIPAFPQGEVLWSVFILGDLHLLATMTPCAQILDGVS